MKICVSTWSRPWEALKNRSEILYHHLKWIANRECLDRLIVVSAIGKYVLRPHVACKREGFMCLITKVNKIQTKFCKVCLNCGCKNGWEAMILTSNKVGNAFGHVATRIRVLGHVLGLHDYFHALNWSKYGDTRNKKSRNFSSKEPVRIYGLALTWGGLG